jgi:hypothetical protein
MRPRPLHLPAPVPHCSRGGARVWWSPGLSPVWWSRVVTVDSVLTNLTGSGQWSDAAVLAAAIALVELANGGAAPRDGGSSVLLGQGHRPSSYYGAGLMHSSGSYPGALRVLSVAVNLKSYCK